MFVLSKGVCARKNLEFLEASENPAGSEPRQLSSPSACAVGPGEEQRTPRGGARPPGRASSATTSPDGRRPGHLRPVPGAASPPQRGPEAGSNPPQATPSRRGPAPRLQPRPLPTPGAVPAGRYSPWRRAGVSGLEERERPGAAPPNPGPPRRLDRSGCGGRAGCLEASGC